MTSIIATGAKQAHALAASLLAKAQIAPGQSVPTDIQVKEDDPASSKTLTFTGKNIILGVPGAFTAPCSSQLPGYIDQYDAFKAKGVQEIYVVAVNDAFVTKAWKEKLGAEKLRFIADDAGEFTSAIGLLFDATGLLGGPRAKRYVLIMDGDKVESVAVEENPAEITVTKADTILAQL